MKVYPKNHRFYGLTWRSVWALYGHGCAMGYIDDRPSIQLSGGGDHVPDVSRDELEAIASRTEDHELMRLPNFGKRSLALLRAGMGIASPNLTYAQKMNRLSSANKAKVTALIVKLFKAQEIEMERNE